MAAPVLRLERLSRRFPARLAVDGLPLDGEPAQIYGLIGPNGSDNTTPVELATGLYRPASGPALVGGIDLHAEPERAKRPPGRVPDQPFAYERTRTLETA